jgi:hypothetical protein
MIARKLLAAPFRYAPWRPRHARLIALDLMGGIEPEYSHDDHLRAAIDWLCRAQDVRNDHPDAGGVSAGWSFEDGWLPSYPETSGYIVETFLAAAEALQRPELIARTQRIIDWELGLQREDGAFPGHFGEPGSQPVIFNTGQIMHGMLAGYLQLGRKECLEAAVRAGMWLARVQDRDGCWRQFEHHGACHTYNTRATWALLATALIADEPGQKSAALRNLDWALAQQRSSGWFANNAFVPDRLPFTHTIAYAIRGFLECGALLGNDTYVGAAIKAARALASAQRSDGGLAGTYDAEWQTSSRYCCLTGVAQMSINWLRCDQIAGDAELKRRASLGIAFLKRHHRVSDRDDAARGAIAGSAPIWGDYSRFEYPNWAAKFFADALMIERSGRPVPPVVAATRTAAQTMAHV